MVRRADRERCKPIGGVPMAPRRFAHLVRTCNRGDIHRYLLSMARMATHSNRYGDSPDLRLGVEMAPTYRYLYGYIGLIRRAPRDKISYTVIFSFCEQSDCYYGVFSRTGTLAQRTCAAR